MQLDNKENQRLWELFHSKWTRDVGTEGYNKKEWCELEGLLIKLQENKRPCEGN